MFLVALLVAGACAFSGWGAYELAHSEYDAVRNSNVHEYTASVASWINTSTRGGLSDFKAIKNMVIAGENFSVQLQPIDKVDQVVHDKGEDLDGYRTWETLRYVYEGGIPLAQNGDTVLPGWHLIEDNLRLIIDNREPQPISLDPINLTTVAKFGTGNWKQCQHYFHGSLSVRDAMCTRYQALRSLCLTVAFGTQGWRLTGRGCTLPLEGKFSPEYARVPTPRFETTPPGPRKTEVSHVTFTIRASGDPYLTALNVTHGEQTFGQTQKQRIASGVIGLTLGMLLLTLALSITFCFCRGIACYEPVRREDPAIMYGSSKPKAKKLQRESFPEIVFATEPDHNLQHVPPSALKSRPNRRSTEKHVRIVSDGEPDDSALAVISDSHPEEVEMGRFR